MDQAHRLRENPIKRRNINDYFECIHIVDGLRSPLGVISPEYIKIAPIRMGNDQPPLLAGILGLNTQPTLHQLALHNSLASSTFRRQFEPKLPINE